MGVGYEILSTYLLGSLGLSLVVTSIGCFKPTGSETTEPKVETQDHWQNNSKRIGTQSSY